MQITEFFDPIEDAETAKFSAPGDAIDGTIAKEPEWVDDKFNPGEKVLLVVVLTVAGYVRIYARKSQLAAIGRELTRKGAKQLTVGGRLRLAYVSDRESTTGNNPAKVWEAEYDAPGSTGDGPVGVGELGDAAPF